MRLAEFLYTSTSSSRTNAGSSQSDVYLRSRSQYLDDAGFRGLQLELMRDPEAGEVVEGSGGLRKVRFADSRRGRASGAV